MEEKINKKLSKDTKDPKLRILKALFTSYNVESESVRMLMALRAQESLSHNYKSDKSEHFLTQNSLEKDSISQPGITPRKEHSRTAYCTKNQSC